jgi:hypothetical protein
MIHHARSLLAEGECFDLCSSIHKTSPVLRYQKPASISIMS